MEETTSNNRNSSMTASDSNDMKIPTVENNTPTDIIDIKGECDIKQEPVESDVVLVGISTSTYRNVTHAPDFNQYQAKNDFNDLSLN